MRQRSRAARASCDHASGGPSRTTRGRPMSPNSPRVMVSANGFRVEAILVQRSLRRPARPRLRVTWLGRLVADCATVASPLDPLRGGRWRRQVDSFDNALSVGVADGHVLTAGRVHDQADQGQPRLSPRTLADPGAAGVRTDRVPRLVEPPPPARRDRHDHASREQALACAPT